MDSSSKMIAVVFKKATAYDVCINILNLFDVDIVQYDDIFNHFVVKSKADNADIIVDALRKRTEVSFASKNMNLTLCAVYGFAYDNFNEGATHGEKVSKTMGDSGSYTIYSRNVGLEGATDKIDKRRVISQLAEDFKAIKNGNKDFHIFNFSFAPGWGKKSNDRDYYKELYVDDIMWLAAILENNCPPNMIITKAMGNEGVHDMDDIFESAYEKMSENKRDIIKNHVVFVSAIDHKTKEEYSNRLEKLNDNYTIATVIIDDLDWSGTSAAAPLLAKWIAEEAEENPNVSDVEMMTALRKSVVPNSSLTNKFRLHEQLERMNLGKSNSSKQGGNISVDQQSDMYKGVSSQDLMSQMQAMVTLERCMKRFSEQLEEAEMLYKRKLDVLDLIGVPIQVVDHYKINCAERDFQRIVKLRQGIEENDLPYIAKNIEQMRGVFEAATK